jgi:hypothetical protein
VLGEEERHVELAENRLEGLGVEQAHSPDRYSPLDRNPLEHPLGELISDRSVGHLREPVADEVLVVAIGQLPECLRHLPDIGWSLAVHAVGEPGMAERHRLDRVRTSTGEVDARGQTRSVADQDVRSPPAAIELEQRPVDDRLAVERVHHRLVADARDVERGDLRPLL